MKGKANHENKYEFPPPIDNLLFFGNCILVNNDISRQNNALSLTSKEWNKIYEKLFEGFDDVELDEGSDDSEEYIDPSLLTKEGYLKNDFIVNDVVDNEDEDSNEDEDEDEDSNEDVDEDEDDDDLGEEIDSDNDSHGEKNKSKSKKSVKKPIATVKNKKKKNVIATPILKREKKNRNVKKELKEKKEVYLDCSMELITEEYFKH